MSRRRSRHVAAPLQSVHVTIVDDDEKVLLTCGRRIGPGEPNDDSVWLEAVPSGGVDHSIEISLTLKEAETFFDQVATLIDDDKQRPLGGLLFIRTTSGGHQYQLDVAVNDPDAETADVSLRRDDEIVAITVERAVLERFLVSCVEGICDDLQSDDDDDDDD